MAAHKWMEECLGDDDLPLSTSRAILESCTHQGANCLFYWHLVLALPLIDATVATRLRCVPN